MFRRLHGRTPIKRKTASAALGMVLLGAAVSAAPSAYAWVAGVSVMLGAILGQASGPDVTARLATKPISRNRF